MVIDSSKNTVKTSGDTRALTEGEIALAQQVFGDKIDYSKVKVKQLPGFIDAGGMSPDGNVYMSASNASADYSQDKEKAAIFMHEMTHVWQHQSGRSVIGEAITQFVKNGGDYKKAYDGHGPDDVKDFNKLNLEQQGAFVEAYYREGSTGKDAGKYMAALQAAGLASGESESAAADKQVAAAAPAAKQTERNGPDLRYIDLASLPDPDSKASPQQQANAAQVVSGSDSSQNGLDADAVGRSIALHRLSEKNGNELATQKIAHEMMQHMVADNLMGGGASLTGSARGAGKGGDLLGSLVADMMGDAKAQMAAVMDLSGNAGNTAHPSGLSPVQIASGGLKKG